MIVLHRDMWVKWYRILTFFFFVGEGEMKTSQGEPLCMQKAVTRSKTNDYLGCSYCSEVLMALKMQSQENLRNCPLLQKGNLERERERGRDFLAQISSGTAGNGPGWSQKLGWVAGTSHLSNHLLPPRVCINRKLNHGQSQDLKTLGYGMQES